MKPVLMPHRHCKICGDALKFPLMASQQDKGLYDVRACKRCATKDECVKALDKK